MHQVRHFSYILMSEVITKSFYRVIVLVQAIWDNSKAMKDHLLLGPTPVNLVDFFAKDLKKSKAMKDQ